MRVVMRSYCEGAVWASSKDSYCGGMQLGVPDSLNDYAASQFLVSVCSAHALRLRTSR